jgi:ClpP class serine protease
VVQARGLRLTVCVDEVAASGGYLMACVADHIVASPFAMMGSIGVISTMPNFYERLKREGVEVCDALRHGSLLRRADSLP